MLCVYGLVKVGWIPIKIDWHTLNVEKQMGHRIKHICPGKPRNHVLHIYLENFEIRWNVFQNTKRKGMALLARQCDFVTKRNGSEFFLEPHILEENSF